ncbi:MAG TPA: TrmH family RNA methyltransferase [Arenimonas sp.]|nr:TrmH family RNA methyltransferase [Arenimonas sp.]
MSSERRPPGDNPYRGPSGPRPDKRARERARAAAAATPATVGHSVSEPVERSAPREQRVYGLNACLALFAARPQDLRKLWLLESRLTALKPVVAWCVKQRIGYTVVGDEDLQKLSGSSHHEGVVMAAVPRAELSLSNWLRDLPPGPQLAIWLDGVGNPHNLGAILRSAAHFGVAAVLLPKGGELAQSGAALRVAEGGGEAVPLVRLGRSDNALAQLVSAGFALAATVVRDGDSLYAKPLPSRLVLVMGAEQSGVSDELAQHAPLRLGIPGSGAVESLNVAAATAVFVGEWRRQHPG